MKQKFRGFSEQVPGWLGDNGEGADIAICTRARLSRNLTGVHFPHSVGDVELVAVRQGLFDRLGKLPTLASSRSFALEELEQIERRVVYEKLFVPYRLVGDSRGRGVMLSETLNLAVTINDEDHIRAHGFRAGLDAHGALGTVMALDREIEGTIEAAFSPEWGYLTASPTNVGTGLRLTVLLHLPALVMIAEIEKVINALRQLQFSVRGLFGEAQAVRGAIFQIGNSITLGRDECEIAQDFQTHLRKVISYERAAREQLYGRHQLGLEDLVWRSQSTLAAARLMTAQETFDCLSNVRLGAGLGILPVPQPGLLNKVTIEQQSGHLELGVGRELSSVEKNAARAALLREYFAG